MIVIADTSPLNYLVVIGEVDLLPKLYSRIMIPPAVEHELQSREAPDIVVGWMERPPGWLTVAAPRSSADSRLARLDRGERDALTLALELKADLVLLDDRDARSVAEQCGLTVAGTLGCLPWLRISNRSS
jgi:predicted nucleic acid-binding protein